jgi:hypothetical protein
MWGRLAFLGLLAGCGFQHGQLASRDDAPPAGGDGPGSDATGGGSDATLPASSDAMVDAPATVLTCPGAYNLHDITRPSSHYRSVTASTTWNGAEADCEDDATANVTLPAHLIVLDDDAERAWAFAQNNSDQWVGITDINNEGVYIPVTDQPTFFTGGATGNLPAKDCLYLNSTTTVSEACGGGHPYLCECDGRAANAANF